MSNKIEWFECECCGGEAWEDGNESSCIDCGRGWTIDKDLYKQRLIIECGNECCDYCMEGKKDIDDLEIIFENTDKTYRIRYCPACEGFLEEDVNEGFSLNRHLSPETLKFAENCLEEFKNIKNRKISAMVQ